MTEDWRPKFRKALKRIKFEMQIDGEDLGCLRTGEEHEGERIPNVKTRGTGSGTRSGQLETPKPEDAV